MLTIQMVKALGHVACHFDVLNLVSTYWHLVGLEQQNISPHQHGVHEQTGRHVCVCINTIAQVFINLCLVGVRTVQHAFAQHAG